MIRLRRVAFLLPSALSESLDSSQSPYSAWSVRILRVAGTRRGRRTRPSVLLCLSSPVIQPAVVKSAVYYGEPEGTHRTSPMVSAVGRRVTTGTVRTVTTRMRGREERASKDRHDEDKGGNDRQGHQGQGRRCQGQQGC